MPKKKKAEKSSRPSHSSHPQFSWIERGMTLIRHPWAAAVFSVLLLMTIVFSFSLQAPTFILHKDSALHVSILAHAGNIPTIVSRDFLLYTSGQYRPVSYIVLAVARTFVDAGNVAFWHLWLLAFHAVNALLVFSLIRHFTKKLWPCLTAALIFAVHPLAAVLVNNIDYFYLIFGVTLSLGSLNAYLVFVRTKKRFAYVLSVVLFLLGLGCARPAFVLGLIVLAYEFLYARNSLKNTILRISPYILFPLILIPAYQFLYPHPLHFKYVAIYEGSLLHGFFSFVGASGKYLSGFFLTKGLWEILHETVQQIYVPWDVRFAVWIVFDLLLLTGAVWALFKKKWWALGIVIIGAAILPYASVAYNRVVDYVSWKYLYFPLVGFAFLGAGFIHRIEQIRRRSFRIGLQITCLILLAFWAGRSIQLNRSLHSPFGYWMKVFDSNNNSQTALYEIGQSCLDLGQPTQALHFFFAPMTKDVKKPCLAMAKHYSRTGDYLAAAVHLRFGSSKQNTGRVLEPHCEVGAELLLAAGALDHAEEHLGKWLMVNPFDTQAMIRLADVWFYKGFVREAYRMLDRVRGIDPHSGEARRLEEEFHRLERTTLDRPDALKVTPPSPDWIDYVISQQRTPAFRQNIIMLSRRLTGDPIVQLEAMISLLEENRFDEAAQKAELVGRHLKSVPYACAVACRAYALSGDVDRAIPIGMHALTLDSQNLLAWDSLAIAHAQKEPDNGQTSAFEESLTRRPATASVYFYNLGLQKMKSGNLEEAVESLEKAVTAKPDHFDAVAALGHALLRMRKAERGIEVLRNAIALKSDDPDVYLHLGQCYVILKQTDLAAGALRTAIKIDPKKTYCHYLLGFLLYSTNQREEAIEEFQRTVELNPKHADAHFKLANCYFYEKNYNESLKHYQTVARIKPDYQYVYLNIGSILQTQGKTKEAIQATEKEIERSPRLPEAYGRMIFLCCENGEYERAKKTAARAKEMNVQLDSLSLARLKQSSEKNNEN